LNTTGALVPRFNAHVVTLVNAPNTLFSPAVNDVVTVITAGPPQHTAGNPLDGVDPNAADVFTTAVNRLQLTGVTLPSAIVASSIPSAIVSHPRHAAVVTVFPGLCSGIPVSPANPWHITVTSFGKNPHPIMFNGTAHSAFTNPVVVGVVTNVPGITFVHISTAGGVHPTPRKHTFPRFRSRCLVDVHSAASFPSNLRSKSGRANVISPPAPVPAVAPSLNSSKIVGSVPSPMQQLQPIAAICPPVSTPNVPASAAAAARLRFVSHRPGGLSPLHPPIEYPVLLGLD